MEAADTPRAEDIFSLDGRVAIVTGASGTLGERYCRVLAGRGATVVAAARRLDRLEALAGEVPGVMPVGCDVTDDSQLRRLVEVAAEHGGPDIVVNNAGTSDAVIRAHEQDPDHFRRVLDINLTAAFVLSAAAARWMIEHGRRGNIVNVASMLGIVASGGNHQAGYVASKSGLIGLTRELAKQWAPEGIRVNAIAPGYFRSGLTEEMFAGDDAPGLRHIERNTLMRRAGEIDEFDGALLLLASDAGSYITGQTILIDGGWTAR
ncbi:MAG: SDR family oxidoreductase [Acidimicrobiia bacterium]|nr:SDR family oxidoreductase [Acidimicrobiia bacterium]